MSFSITYACTDSEAGWKNVQEEIWKEKLPTAIIVGGSLCTISYALEPLLLQYFHVLRGEVSLNAISAFFQQQIPTSLVKSTPPKTDVTVRVQQVQSLLKRNSRVRSFIAGSCVATVAAQSLLAFQRGVKEHQHEVNQGIAAISISDASSSSSSTPHLPVRMIHNMQEITRPSNGKMLFISPSESAYSHYPPHLLQQHKSQTVLPLNYHAAPQVIAKAIHRKGFHNSIPSVNIQSHDLHQVDAPFSASFPSSSSSSPSPTAGSTSKNEALISAFSFANDLHAQIYQLQHQQGVDNSNNVAVVPLNIQHISDDESLFSLWKMSHAAASSSSSTKLPHASSTIEQLHHNIKQQFLPRHADLEIDEKFLQTFEDVMKNNMIHIPFSLTPINKGQLSLINIKGFLVLEIIRQVAEKLPIFPEDASDLETGKISSSLEAVLSVVDAIGKRLWKQVVWCGQCVSPAVTIVGTTMMNIYATVGSCVICGIDSVGTVVSSVLELDKIVALAPDDDTDDNNAASNEGDSNVAIEMTPVVCASSDPPVMKTFTLSDILTSNKCTIILDDLAPTTSSTGTTSSVLAMYLMKELSKFGLKSTTLSKLEEHTMMEDVTNSVMTLSERMVYSLGFMTGMVHELLWEGYRHGVSLIVTGEWAKMSSRDHRILSYRHHAKNDEKSSEHSNNSSSKLNNMDNHEMASCQVIVSIVQSEEEALYRTFLLTRKYPKCHIILIAYGGQYKESYYENEEIHSLSKKKKRVGFIDAKHVMEKIWA